MRGRVRDGRLATRDTNASDDIAAFEGDLCSERSQPSQVQVDGPVADGAAAGHRDPRLAPPGEHRAEHADAGAHGPDNVIGCGREGFVLGHEGDAALAIGIVLVHRAAEPLEKIEHVGDVRQARDMAKGDGLIAEQSGGHEGQAGVFGSVDLDSPAE